MSDELELDLLADLVRGIVDPVSEYEPLQDWRERL